MLLRAKRELNAIIGDRSDCPAANFFAGGDVKLLPNLRAQDPSKMRSVLPDQSSSVSRHLVGNPTTACHGSGLRSLVSGLRSRFQKRLIHWVMNARRLSLRPGT